MELKLLLTLLRRWAWFLVLGVLLGAAGGYVASLYEEPVYQASTKVMVIRPQESSVTANITLSDQELAQTYVALLTTDPVLEAAGERLGFGVSEGQISARQTSGTRLLEVTVRANDAQRAALIANTLVEVLIEQNNNLQSNRFAASEESLQAQINQVEEQINQLQESISGGTAEGAQARQEALEEQIATLRSDIVTLQQEISDLTSPSLSPAEREELLQKQVELSQLRFELSTEQSAYNSRLSQNPNFRDPETEERILDLQEQILRMEQEIEDMRSASVAGDAGTETLLAEKRSELNQKQFELQLAESRYASLLSNDGSASGEDGGSQSRQQTTLSLYQQLYSNLLSTYESVRLARLQNTPDLVQVEAATVPGRAIQPQPLQNTLLGAAVGLIVMGAIAFLIEYLDDTLKTPAEISRLFNVPVIGFIAKTASNGDDEERVIVAEEPRSPIAEAFRALRTNLEFAGVDQPLQTILVTSPSPADGKTTVAANLAAIMAQGGNRVVLLDADLRRPRTHRFLGVSNQHGLSDLFRTAAPPAQVAQRGADVDNLQIVTTGNLPPNPAELLGSERMDRILEQLKDMGDVVIIDSPPFIVSDPALLAARVDGVLLVLRPGETSVDAAQAVLEQLQRADARVVGAVLNQLPRRRGSYYGGFRYYYAPYYEYTGRYYMNGEGANGRRRGQRESPLRWALNRLRGTTE